MATITKQNWTEETKGDVVDPGTTPTGLQKVVVLKVSEGTGSGTGDANLSSTVWSEISGLATPKEGLVVTQSDASTTRAYQIPYIDTSANEAWIWVYGNWDLDDTEQIRVMGGTGDGTDYSWNGPYSSSGTGNNPWQQSGVNAELVYLMNEASGTILDSSGNGRDSLSQAIQNYQTSTAQTGYGVQFDGTDDNIRIYEGLSTWRTNHTTVFHQNAETIDGFLLHPRQDADLNHRYNSGNFDYSFYDGSNVQSVVSSVTAQTNTWYCTIGAFDDGTELLIFANGTEDTASTTTAPDNTAGEAYIAERTGNNPWDGYISAFHMHSGVKSSTWRQAEYDMLPVGGQTFFSWSSPTSTEVPVVETDTPSGITNTDFDGNGNITSDSGSSVDERGFVYDTTSYSNPGGSSPASSNYSSVENETGTFSTGTYSLNISGLTDGTTYYFRAYAHNTNGYAYGQEFKVVAGEYSESDSTNADFDQGTYDSNTESKNGSVQITSNISQYDQESFESGFGDWVNGGSIETSSDTWTRNTGGTPSSSTGPSSAQDGSYYVYVETSAGEGANNAGNETIMEISLGGTSEGDVSFYWHKYGDDQGDLYLEGYDGSSWTTIWSRSGGFGNQWNFEDGTNTSFSGYSDLRFRNVAAGSFNGDVALDLITINTGSGFPTSGQYTSDQISMSRLERIGDSDISWTETLNGQTLTIESRYSTDGGSSWSSWTQETNGGVVTGADSIGSNTSNALFQYRANFSGDGTDTPTLDSITLTGIYTAGTSDPTGGVIEMDSNGVVQNLSDGVVKTD